MHLRIISTVTTFEKRSGKKADPDGFYASLYLATRQYPFHKEQFNLLYETFSYTECVHSAGSLFLLKLVERLRNWYPYARLVKKQRFTPSSFWIHVAHSFDREEVYAEEKMLLSSFSNFFFRLLEIFPVRYLGIGRVCVT